MKFKLHGKCFSKSQGLHFIKINKNCDDNVFSYVCWMVVVEAEDNRVELATFLGAQAKTSKQKFIKNDRNAYNEMVCKYWSWK